MSRDTANIVAAFAVLAISLVSMQVVTSVPPAQLALIEAPALA